MASTITFQQLIEYHSIDRQIYARLVFGLSLDSNLAKKIVTFWYWLELEGYKNFIKNVLTLPDTMLSGFAMEAKTCLCCLNSHWSSEDFANFDKNIPLMRYLVNQDFSLTKVYADRGNALRMMERLLKDVFERVFIDIIPRNVVGNRYDFRTAVTHGFQVPAMVANGVQVQTLLTNRAQVLPVLANGIQIQDSVTSGAQVQPMVTNGAQVHNNGCNSKMRNGQEDNGNQEPPMATQNLHSVFHQDRTLFMTFSKGHPAMSKAELRDLIASKYGNCVESIHMRHDPPPLFARVVLKSASAMAKILGENDLVKLCSNGKDVWARRFIPKRDEQPPLASSTAG